MTKLEELAAIPCKECGGIGERIIIDLMTETCPACEGTGALVPGLRKPCNNNKDRHANFQGMRAKGSEYQKCPHCGLVGYGEGYILVPEDKAFLAMWNFCTCRAWQVLRVTYATMIVELTEDSYIEFPIVHTRIIATAPSTDAEALAAAIMHVKR